MKTYILLSITCFLLIITSTSCSESVKKEETTQKTDSISSSPTLSFEESTHDFGTVLQGEKVSHSFTFTNNGNADLIISSATGSCGCTVPSFPKEPIAPGKSGKINVVFDSEGKMGRVDKSVTIMSNCNPNMQNISISANIINP